MNRDTVRLTRYLGALLGAVYFASYLTRINFGAVLSEITRAEGVSKTDLSFVTTGLFITYGLGQLVSGWLGDHIPPHLLIASGLLLSALMNILLPLFPLSAAVALWCVNGFGQAMIWPPIVRILSMRLDERGYSRATISVSRGGSLGTILIYLAAPLLIALSGWRLVFFFCGGVALAVAVFFLAISHKMPQSEPARPAQPDAVSDGSQASANALSSGILFVLLAIMVCITLQGTLRDGVTTWMPSYISETFDLGSRISILTGVLNPLFGLACYDLTVWLYHRFIRSELACAAAIFSVGLCAALLLYLFTDASPVLSVLLSVLLAGCMHGVNLLLVCIVPRRFVSTGHVSTISGVLNFCTYIGSALSVYVIAALADRSGWHAAILAWLAVAAAGTLLCFLISGPWRSVCRKLES